MHQLFSMITVLSLTAMSAAKNPRPGLLAEWNFDEGQGEVAGDSSGNGHDAHISGATWVKQADGFSLSLDGIDDYVDCGESRDLGIVSPITIEAWVKPGQSTPDNAILFGAGMRSYLLTFFGKKACWFIAHHGGSLSNWVRGELDLDEWNHVVATFDTEKIGLWVNGRHAQIAKSVVKSYDPAGHFFIGTKGRPDLPKFKGLVDKLRVYDSALSDEQIVSHFKAEAAQYDFDPTWFQRLRMTPYYYLDRRQIVLEANYRGLQPLAGSAQLDLTLSRQSSPNRHLQQQLIEKLPATGVLELALPFKELRPDNYLIRVKLQDDERSWPVEELKFSSPAPPPVVLSPTEATVAALPPQRKPTPFTVGVSDKGGFTITIKETSYPFQTRVSWPHGDFNQLAPQQQGLSTTNERSWKVTTQATGPDRYTIEAGGDFYRIQRRVEVFPTHVYIKDTYTNTTDNDLGLLVYNETPLKSGQVQESLLSGRNKRGRQREGRVPDWGPTAFFTDANCGMGIVPLDDVFVIQVIPYIDWQNAAGLCTEKLALAAGRSYTLEWAVYPTGSGDYYDFINRFRQVEDRISTVQSGASFITHNPSIRRQVPSRDFIEKQGIQIGLISGLADAADDPQISIQGIEFMDFPQERELIRRQMAAIHRRLPGFKAVVHIAHSLYTTDRPERFADSKVVDANGKQHIWNYGYGYLGKQRQEEGWRSWIFYPTPGNSFHDALMASADVVMDEMGCDGVFMDGFLAGYISRWTFDRWDGHSAQIDLQTKTIKQKLGSVLLLSQPSLVQFARKIHDRGGIVIANNAVITRTIANEKYIIHDSEAGAGPQLHLAPNITGLGRTTGHGEKALYENILDTLKWGNLYMGYYLPRTAGRHLTRP